MSTVDGTTSIDATKPISKPNTALPSCASNAISGSSARRVGMCIARATWTISSHSQSNAIPLPSVGPWPPPVTSSWKQHLDEHFGELEKKDELAQTSDERKATPCPDPRCGLSFDAVADLQYHAQDIHCCERTKACPSKRLYHPGWPRSKIDDGFIAFGEPDRLRDPSEVKYRSNSIDGYTVTFNSEKIDPAVSPGVCYNNPPFTVDQHLIGAAPPFDSSKSTSGPDLALLIDPRFSDPELLDFDSSMGLDPLSSPSDCSPGSNSDSPTEFDPLTPDLGEVTYANGPPIRVESFDHDSNPFRPQFGVVEEENSLTAIRSQVLQAVERRGKRSSKGATHSRNRPVTRSQSKQSSTHRRR
ncbi:uncharacterized protein A1O9_00054 [Exophiala aquamarina CBS 119918]|uniref:C2H2-type domain-containing protein n=1 Tax=Exophiala aquamarina CBS 119918 TaxID=1182545 RepID=A0A072PQQ1_9EURO|nr:uncharacterized protein A1O9_00054 [Exophiala aquamarina CBS 119918]KEF62082.1 hypothetical protein A1O9_00054 [Exophiala aquamarina CBS 119918]